MISSSAQEALGLYTDGPIVLIYAGNLGRDRFRPLLNLANATLRAHNTQLLIAGFGELEKYASKIFTRIPRVSYLGTLSRDEVMRQTSLADCVVLPYDSNLLNNVISLPNRFFEALSSSKPLLVQKGTRVAQIVEDNNCGIVTDFRDIKEIRRALTIIEEGGRNLLSKMGFQAKQLYQTKYRWDLIEKGFLQLYQQIMDVK